jgi:hypothetical protein
MLSVMYAGCHLCSVTNEPFMLGIVMLNATMLGDVMLNVVKPDKHPIFSAKLHKELHLGTV